LTYAVNEAYFQKPGNRQMLYKRDLWPFLWQVIHVAKQKQKSGPLGECDVCGRAFTNPRMLRIHKDNVHGKLRPHLCNFCGYSASSRSTLKMHMRLHTGK